MKKAGRLLLVSLLVFAMVIPAFGFSASANVMKEIYVALNGNDSNAGSVDAPLATLEAARDKIRAMKQENGGLPAGGIRVYLREGTYVLKQGFKLTQEDSGTKECPIIYTNYPGENVSIEGGKQLSGTDFKNVSDKDALARIPKAAAKKVLVYDLKAAGITEYGKAQASGYHITQPYPMPQLYYNNELLDLARWPNEDFSIYGSVADEGLRVEAAQEKTGSKDPDVFTKVGGAKIFYNDEAPNRWKDAKDIMIFGYFNNDWSPNTVVVKEIDTTERSITFEGPTAYGVKEGRRFYAMNLLEELDAEGEWYLDRETGKLYIYPKGDIKTAEILLSTLRDDLIALDQCDYVTFAGLHLGLCLGSGVSAYESQNVLVRDCVISNVGSHGVFYHSKYTTDTYMDVTYWPLGCVGTRSRDNGVVDSEIYSVGSSGIEFAMGDRVNLIPGGGYAENNVIHGFGQINRTYNPGVNLWGCGNYARFNRIYDGPHIGIQFNGNDLSVEYNEFYDVVKETDDAGAIYAYGQNSYLGNKVNYNYIHDIETSAEQKVGVVGIYLDDHICGTEIIGNVLDNVKSTGIFLKGKNNTVKYNILQDVSRGFFFSDFDVGANMTPMYQKNKETGFLDSPVWAERYPDFASITEIPGADLPSGNIAEKNVLINSTYAIDKTFASLIDMSNNFTTSADNAGFVDVKTKNFNLKDDSEVLKKFDDFPRGTFDKIGPYESRFNVVNSQLVSLFVGSPVAFSKGKETRVDKENVDVMPVIQDGRTLVPARFIAESFGAQIDWKPETATASIALDGKTIQLTLGSDQMLVDGASVTLDVPAQSVEGRTLIPLRSLVEAIGKKVFWDDRGLICIGDTQTPFGEELYLVDSLIRYFR